MTLGRRNFITLLGGAAAWPLTARAQQPAVPVIGVLSSLFLRDELFNAFRQGLGETGYAEGRNVAIELHGAENQTDRIPLLAADLVRRRVAVILATGEAAAKAARAATATIPIVFATGGDPVRAGLVASLNQPGGNVTGLSYFSGALGAKQLEIIHELIPNPGPLALVINPDNPTDQSEQADVQVAAAAIGQPIEVLSAKSNADLEAAFAAVAQRRGRGLLIAIDPLFFSVRSQLVALAARHALPAIYWDREFVEAGGLISYGASGTQAYHQIGLYVGRILKGERPAGLPVMLPAKFELVINLKTAKALGLTVPATLLATADEVIEQ
jgi:putative tryptophan/tyrosine transport system substrate-binding protein